MPKNEDVKSQQVKEKKEVNASFWSGVILGQTSLIFINLLYFPKWKSTSILCCESRKDRWASNSVITSVLTVLTTICCKPLRRQCLMWTMIFVSNLSLVCIQYEDLILLISVELRLNSLFTEMNTMVPLITYLPERSSKQP